MTNVVPTTNLFSITQHVYKYMQTRVCSYTVQQSTRITPHKNILPEPHNNLAFMSHMSAYISISHQNHNLHCALSCHFHFLPSVKQKIICTLSLTSTHTSNFPLLIQHRAHTHPSDITGEGEGMRRHPLKVPSCQRFPFVL